MKVQWEQELLERQADLSSDLPLTACETGLTQVYVVHLKFGLKYLGTKPITWQTL